MNDDRLRTELQRRADSAEVPSLLPAVRHAIDTRPQPVGVSRWSPLVGIATVAAVIFLLLVAVPRLTSPVEPGQSPTVAATTSPPSGSLNCGTAYAITMTDATGLVAACDLRSGDASQGTNLAAGSTQISVAWHHATCDSELSASFEVLGGGYQLTLVESAPPPPSDPPTCRGGRQVLTMTLSLRSAISSDVRATINGVAFSPPIKWHGPTPDIAGTPTPAPDDIACQWDFSGQPGAPIIREAAVVTDFTGMIRSCETVLPTLARVGERVVNPGGNPNTLRIDWYGGLCSASDTFSLAMTDTGFELVHSAQDCVLSAGASYAINLHLGSPINAQSVTLTREGGGLDPTPAQPVLPVACDPSTSGQTPVRLADHAGIVTSCVVMPDDPNPTDRADVQPGPDAADIRVSWPLPNCAIDAVEVQLWGPISYGSAPASVVPNYFLGVGQSSPTGPCTTLGGSPGTMTVELTLIAPMADGDLDVFAMGEGSPTLGVRGGDIQETAVGKFELSLFAAPTGADPTEVSAATTYRGSDPVTIYCGGYPELSLLQLDGDISLPAGAHVAMCTSEDDLSPGDLLATTFTRPGGLDPTNPDYAFYDQYMPDGQLRLPPGSYLITARVYFNLSQPGTGEQVSLQASVIFTVQ